MTSKHLLWTRWVQQNKRNLWLYVVNSILFLCYGPLHLLYYLSTNINYHSSWEQETIGFNFAFCLFFVALGVLGGIYSFSYLHSQKKIDFYHSQPLSAGNRFLNICSSGLLCCYIPYMVSFFLNLIIIKIYGNLTFDLFQQALASALLYMLAYFAAYQIAILMTIISGNILYSIALTGVAFIYELMVRKLIVEFSAMFFQNYSYPQGRKTLQCQWSAVWALLQKTEKLVYFNSSKELWEATGSTCIRVAILSIMTTAIAYLAYRKRPMEYTGPSLAFEKLKPIIKVLVTSLTLSTFFFIRYERESCDGFATYDPTLFITTLLFLVLGVCMFHVLFEFLWELDIRATKKHLISALVALECTLAFICIFYFDLFGYDTYVPNQKDVESVGIALENYHGDFSLHHYNLENAQLSCIKEACDAAKELCNNNTNDRLDLSYTQTVVTADFAFHMKNGSTCYRAYELIVDKGKKPLPNLLNHKEYQKATYPFLYDDKYVEKINLKKKKYLSWRDKSEHEVTLTPTGKEQIKKLQQALLADYKDSSNNSPYTFQDEHKAIGLLTVKYPENNKKVYDTEYLIFPEYTRTMECLHEMGVTTDTTTGFSLEEIESVKICTYNDEKNKKAITDQTQIKELLSLVDNNWQPTNMGLDNDYQINIQFKNYKNTDTDFFVFYDEVPDWLTEMFKNSKD